MPVPRTIHQLWKNEVVPDRYRAFCESWRRHNPGWTYRLWTDADLLELVEARYPGWLPIFNGYERAISRADLGRYLVLDAFGGVYADLDCECLRPIGPLVDDAGFLIAVEPAAHNRYYGTEQVICISFIASAPGHPFWRTVLDEVRGSTDRDGVLEQTGPLMMNRAYARFEAKASIRLLPAALVYPFTDQEARDGRAHDIAFWEQATREAFVAHYWDNSWFKPSGLGYGLPLSIPAQVNAIAGRASIADEPLISCLMPSARSLAGVRAAVGDYLQQSYARRELLIGVREPEAALAEFVARLERPDIRLVRLDGAPPDEPLPLAPALLVAAAGEAVCGWEEGVRHDPRRLEVQQKVRRGAQSAACLPQRRMIWRPQAGRIAIGTGQAPESVLADALEMRILAQRGPLGRGWFEALNTAMRTAVFDLPRLMLEVHDSDDPAAAEVFEAAWRDASVQFPQERTTAVVAKIADRITTLRRELADAPEAGRHPAGNRGVVARMPELG